MRNWTRLTAEQAVIFYTGLIGQGIPLTVDEKKSLTAARQFLRGVRKGTIGKNPKPALLTRQIKVGDRVRLREEQVYGKVRRIAPQVGHYWIDWDDGEYAVSRRADIIPVLDRPKKAGRLPNAPVKIYDNVSQIKAEKGTDSNFPNQPFYHDFKPGAKAYGLPNGDILITKKKLR